MAKAKKEYEILVDKIKTAFLEDEVATKLVELSSKLEDAIFFKDEIKQICKELTALLQSDKSELVTVKAEYVRKMIRNLKNRIF